MIARLWSKYFLLYRRDEKEREEINKIGITYEARKSTPTDLGSRKKARECKSVAKTVCITNVRLA